MTLVLQDLTTNRKSLLCSILLFWVKLLIFSKHLSKTGVMSSTPSVRWLGWLRTCSKYGSFRKHWPCCTLVRCMHALLACCQRGSGQHTHTRVTDFLPADQFVNPLLDKSCLPGYSLGGNWLLVVLWYHFNFNHHLSLGQLLVLTM